MWGCDHAVDGRTQLGAVQALAGASQLGGPIIGLNALNAGLASIIAVQRPIHLRHGGFVFGLGRSQLSAVLPVRKSRQDRSGAHRIAFANLNTLDYAFDFGLYENALRRTHRSVAYHAKGQRERSTGTAAPRLRPATSAARRRFSSARNLRFLSRTGFNRSMKGTSR